MPSPVFPSQFKAAIIGPFSTICSKLKSAFAESNLFYQYFAWMFNEDGSFSDDYKAELCNISCVSGGTGGSGGSGGGGDTGTGSVFGPPSLKASYRAYTDKVVLTWGQVADATKYYIYRSTNANPVQTDYLGLSDSLTYVDSTAASETDYNYWARAVKADGTLSNFSSVAVGRVRTSTPNPTQLQPPGFVDIRAESGILVAYWAAVAGVGSYVIKWSGEGVTPGQTTLAAGTLSYNTRVPVHFSGASTTPTRVFVVSVQAIPSAGGVLPSVWASDNYVRTWLGNNRL